MARATFYPADHFARDRAAPYTFLPFRFIDLDSRKMVVNEVGEYLLLSQSCSRDFSEERFQQATRPIKA